MTNKKKTIPAHYSWNSSIFTRGVVDPIKRKLGYVDENEHPVSLKESATGQELDRMNDTAKKAATIAMTGLGVSSVPALARYAVSLPQIAIPEIAAGLGTGIAGAKVGEKVGQALGGDGYWGSLIGGLGIGAAGVKGLDALRSAPKIVGKGNALGYRFLKGVPEINNRFISEIEPGTAKVIEYTNPTSSKRAFRLGTDHVPPTPETHTSKFRTIYPTEYNSEKLTEAYSKNMLRGAESRGEDAYTSKRFIGSLSNNLHYGIGSPETGYITGIPIAQGRGLLPTHIAPTGLKGSTTMLKELSTTREPVVMAVTPDISSMAERLGFRTVGTVEQPFNGTNVVKNIVVNSNTALEDIPLTMSSDPTFKLGFKPSIKIGHRTYFSEPTSHYIGQNQYVNPSEAYVETNPEIIAQDRDFLKKVNAYYKSKKYVPLDLNLSKYGTDVVNNAVKDRITQHLTTLRGVRPRKDVGSIIPEQLEHDVTHFVPMNSVNNGGRAGVGQTLLTSGKGILYSSPYPNHQLGFTYKVARPTDFSGPRETWMKVNEPTYRVQSEEPIPAKVFRRMVREVTGNPIEQWEPYQKLLTRKREAIPGQIQSYIDKYKASIDESTNFLNQYFGGEFKYPREFRGAADAKALEDLVSNITHNPRISSSSLPPRPVFPGSTPDPSEPFSYRGIHYPRASVLRKQISGKHSFVRELPWGDGEYPIVKARSSWTQLRENPELYYPGAAGKWLTGRIKVHRQKTPTLSKYIKGIYSGKNLYKLDQNAIKELQQQLDLSKFKNGELLYTGGANTYIGTPETQGFRIISAWPEEAAGRFSGGREGSQDAFISRNFKQGGILKRK